MTNTKQATPLVFTEAVRAFWQIREQQLARSARDQGVRGAATGGKQMQGFVQTIGDYLQAAGVPAAAIHEHQVELPGYFRPTKAWDMVVINNGQLGGVVELKSHVGPSFGNNFNNRIEEAIGSAVDIRAAFQAGTFQPSPQPWLGYLFLLEDCSEVHRPVRVAEPHFPVRAEFQEASYAQRYEQFCLKLLQWGHYQGVCLLLADRQKADESENYAEPNTTLSAQAFLAALQLHFGQGH
jgi:hypothetical protein